MLTRYRTLWILLALAVPLGALLIWSACLYPDWDGTSQIFEVDDEYAVIVYQSFSAPVRYMWLNRKTGMVRRAPLGLEELVSTTPTVLSGSRIASVGWGQPYRVQVLSPRDDRVQIYELGNQSPSIIGNRYLISTQDEFGWIDLDAPSPRWRHDSETDVDHVVPFYNEVPYFYALYSPFKEDEMGMEPFDSMGSVKDDIEAAKLLDADGVLEPPVSLNPEWDAILRDRDSLTPTPLAAFNNIEMFVLYRMTPDGPRKVAHWPVGTEVGKTKTGFASGSSIFTMSLDGNFIDAHDAITGAITQQYPVVQQDARDVTHWSVSAYAIQLDERSGSRELDILSGLELTRDPTDKFLGVIAKAADRYVTLASANSAEPFGFERSFPMLIQLRHYPDGQVLASYPDSDGQTILSAMARKSRLTEDGQRLISVGDGRIQVLDALTGQVLETQQVAGWIYRAYELAIGLMILWIALWIRAADRVQVPRLASLLIVSCLLTLFLILRANLVGDPTDAGRLANLLILAILAAWGAEWMQHLCRPQSSLLSRTIASASYLAAVYVLSWLVAKHAAAEVFAVGGLMCICFGLFFLSMRRGKKLEALRLSDSIRSQFTLRGLIVLMAFAAAMFAYVRQESNFLQRLFVPPTLFWFLGITICLSIFALAVRYSFWFRIIAVPLTIALAATTRYGYQIDCTSKESWMIAAAVACLAVTCSFQAVPLRARSTLPPTTAIK